VTIKQQRNLKAAGISYTLEAGDFTGDEDDYCGMIQ